MRHRFMLAALLAVAGALAVPAVGTAAPGALFAPNHKISQSTSSNWSGYAATGGGFQTVSANWTQPTATCGATATYSSFWVGIDGDGSGTVEQTGTSADCSGGGAKYYAREEMYPNVPTNLSLRIRH